MPIFEFQCEECGEVFEELVLRSDAEVKCKRCKGTKVQKLISKVAFKSGNTFVSSSGSSCGSCSGKTCSSCK